MTSTFSDRWPHGDEGEFHIRADWISTQTHLSAAG